MVIGDLAPPIIANSAGMSNTENLRSWILIAVAAMVVLPLSLIRNLNGLMAICTLSIGFYLCVTVFIGFTAWDNLSKGEWSSSVNWWRPAGIFQCLPIFTMALSCQAQVFEVYDNLQVLLLLTAEIHYTGLQVQN